MDKKRQFKGALALARGAAIAAMYAALSLAFAPISYGLMQVRVSEALCVLPMYTAAAVPGLFVGCLLANALGVALGLSTLPDVILGSLATLFAALLTRLIAAPHKAPTGKGRNSRPRPSARFLAPLPAVLVNALIVGWELCYIFAVGAPFLTCAAYVALGQLLSCYVLGVPLTYALDRLAPRLF